MALPKIDAPIFDLTLPLSKKQIKFRPFLVKEQRNLLMALESDDSETIETNIREVLKNCTQTEGINFDNLPITDVEYYFLHLRARSVGEVVENKYRCNNLVTKEDGTEKECGTLMDVNVNLLEIKVEGADQYNDTIQLTDKLTVKLNYPKFSVIKRATNSTSITDLAFDVIAESVEYIFDGQQYYYAKETAPAEMIEFIESLSQEQFSKIEDFFTNLPKLNKKIEVDCKKCGFHHRIDVEGLESFFV